MLPALHRDCISVSRNSFKLSFERAVCGDFECVLAVCKRYRLAVQRYGLHAVAAVRGHCERYFCAALIISSAGRYCTVLPAVYGHNIGIRRYLRKLSCECGIALNSEYIFVIAVQRNRRAVKLR